MELLQRCKKQTNKICFGQQQIKSPYPPLLAHSALISGHWPRKLFLECRALLSSCYVCSSQWSFRRGNPISVPLRRFPVLVAGGPQSHDLTDSITPSAAAWNGVRFSISVSMDAFPMLSSFLAFHGLSCASDLHSFSSCYTLSVFTIHLRCLLNQNRLEKCWEGLMPCNPYSNSLSHVINIIYHASGKKYRRLFWHKELYALKLQICVSVCVCTQARAMMCVHKCAGAYMPVCVHSEAREGYLVSSFVTGRVSHWTQGWLFWVGCLASEF